MKMTLNLNVRVTPAEAMALAQFVKRVGWTEFIANAVDEDEAYDIRDAIYALQDALAEEGYAPR
ncbi:hypothetical protein [Duganella violaceipulchra]|uniref:Dissimilatory sulfite reductase (Desulfoviridin) alpha/beta subunit n=1 Tax=Duganella violaceipulchra TaxID=2849652 RepID=A0AA41H5J7_9BURK|nr:hypothetical protein [Duganella violaceicalia]MBV6322143.1 hypothetical protein [Duganella violaceicalia]MCP2011290.1 dissimilatory sulfite reductase (desulfoviridin) alpha/beta subunit [Duganella violaceicalia]